MEYRLKQDKGVAGLTLLLSLVTFLFVIGLLTVVFALMGGELRDANYDATTATVTNETDAWLNSTTYTVDEASANNFRSLTITDAWNATDDSPIGTGNFSVSGTGFTNASTDTWDNVTFSYTYTYDDSNDATNVIGNTTDGISGVTDFFDIFIVIGAMVVLILLTVIIITAIRGSGLMTAGGGA